MTFSWLSAYAFVVLVGLLAVTTAMLVTQDRRPPQSTLAWLLFLILAPYIAVPSFLALGFRKRRAGQEKIAFDGPIDYTIAEGSASPVDLLLRRYKQPGAVAGNRFELAAEPDKALRGLMAMVTGAEHSIDVTLYLLGDDPVGRGFVAALEARARSGVRVRVILDNLGAWRRPRQALRRLQTAGGQVQMYSRFLHGPLGGRVNLRNHRKMVIVDGLRVFAGGRNVADEYFSTAADGWQDLSFVIEGPVAADFDRVFRSDWIAAGGALDDMPAPAAAMQAFGNSTLQLALAGPDVADDPVHDALQWAFHNATRRIWIVTPYYLPTAAIGDALAIAVRRGVDIRLLVPETSNQRMADLARGAYLRALQGCGGKVLRYGGMVHAKAVLVDDMAVVGSANLDIRSLLLNYEDMVFLHDAADVTAIGDWMEDLMAGATDAPLTASRKRRLIEGLFRLGAPIL